MTQKNVLAGGLRGAVVEIDEDKVIKIKGNCEDRIDPIKAIKKGIKQLGIYLEMYQSIREELSDLDIE